MSGSPAAEAPAADEVLSAWFDEQFRAIVAALGEPGDEAPAGPPGTDPVTTSAPLPPGRGAPRGRWGRGRPVRPVRRARDPWTGRRVRSPPPR